MQIQSTSRPERAFHYGRDEEAEARDRARAEFELACGSVLRQGTTGEERQLLQSLRPWLMDPAGCLVLAFGDSDAAAEAPRWGVFRRLEAELKRRPWIEGVVCAVEPAEARPEGAMRARRSAPEARLPGEVEVVYLPAPFVSHTLPHRPVAGGEFTRRNGRRSLTLLAPAAVGLPWGVYGRLLLMHFTTRAVLDGRVRFRVGDSVTDTLQLAGIGRQGGSRGPLTRGAEQLRRLRHTTYRLVESDKRGRRESGAVLVTDFRAGPNRPAVLTLGLDFHRMALRSAVPLDLGIVRQVRRSPLAFDQYCWLTYRASTLQKPTVIPWADLAEQFGGKYGKVRFFRRAFASRLRTLRGHWPELTARPLKRGLLLRPGPPSVLDVHVLRRGRVVTLPR